MGLCFSVLFEAGIWRGQSLETRQLLGNGDDFGSGSFRYIFPFFMAPRRRFVCTCLRFVSSVFRSQYWDYNECG